MLNHVRTTKFWRQLCTATAVAACILYAGVHFLPIATGQAAPTVTTDKSDYEPGETVLIAGTGFWQNETVTLHVTHVDGTPTGGQGHDPWDVTADGSGGINSAWVVDPDDSAGSRFLLTADGHDSGLHAETTFTDLSIGTYDQCSNDLGTGYTTGDTGCRWLNGNLQANNSIYKEGDATIQRVWLNQLVPGSTHTITLKYGTTKGGKHAYDFLTTWNWSENWSTVADRCQDITGCTGATDLYYDIPQDPNVPNGFEPSAPGDRQFTMRGGTPTGATTPAIDSGDYASDSETVITVTFTVGASGGPMCATTGPNAGTCGVALWFGAHVSAQANWGLGLGAGSIEGSPYHVSLDAIDGASVGQRDNQMQAGVVAVIPNGTIIIVKNAVPDDNQDFSFNLSNNSTITQDFLLDDDSQNGPTDLLNSQTFSVPPGGWTASELNIPAGWNLTNLVCVDPTGNTSVNVGTGVATISLASNETVTCTYTDTKNCQQDCNDSNPCTDDACDIATGLCTHTNNTNTCSDGNACTTDACVDGACVGTPITCNDNTACTTDTCDPSSGCVYTPITCNDNSACTTDTCDPASGCVYTPITCNDNSACTTDTCNPASGCVYTPITCNDNSACTTDTCDPSSGCVYTPITCNDNSACTTDTCNPASGCVYTPITCNDNSACTTDTCNPASGCVYTPITCNDNSACTTDTCDPSSGCVYTPITCNDNSACTTDTCNPASGCVYTPITCNDNSACTTDTCNPASGCVYTPITCNDNSACTTDTCNPASGCVYTPITCNDNSACTTDTCDPSSGCVYTPITCNDNSACTTDTCNPASGCVYTPITCNDNSACTTDTCDPSSGCVYTPITCNDSSACTTDTCDPASGCVYTPITCNDNSACTTDTCDPATGCVYTPITCNDNSACTTDTCDPATGCVYTPITCNDNSACTTDTCDPATGCVYAPVVCPDDNNVCTIDTCDPATGCKYDGPAANGNSCDDGNACTGVPGNEDVCVEGQCQGGGGVVCDDGNACTDDSCNPATGCVYNNDNTNACNDGNACTNDACVGGSCVGTPITCNDGNACTDDSCNPATGCVYTNDNTNACNDGSACTTDACVEGSCVGTPITCNDGNACTDDSCNPATGCVYTNDNTNACNDGNACTNDACVGGSCVGTPITCNDGNACTDDSCNPATGCVYTNDNTNACNDGNACTNDACVGGSCVGTTITCNDGNVCTTDTCNPASGCVYTNNTAPCNDGNACTTGDVCSGGTCHAGTATSCNDNNLCTNDSCNPTTGCVHTNKDNGSTTDTTCGQVTDTLWCALPTGLCGTNSTAPEFRLIDLQDPTFSSIQNKTVMNDYIINASNPGQFYYNVFYYGAPGSVVNLTIEVPYPFVTQGANPIQVHSGVGSSGGCYVPSPSLPGFTITTEGGSSSSGYPIILRSDYSAQQLGSTTTVTVGGFVPSTGLAYVTIHLDYGLKKVTGWQQAADLTTAQGPDTNLDNVLDGLGDGPIFIQSPQPYGFDFSGGGPTHTYTPSSCNVFKKNPGVNGNTLKLSSGNPASNVRVQFFKPNGQLVGTTTTDVDGFYQFIYKHTGKAAIYTVKLPDLGKQKTVTLKANGYARVDFEDLP